MSYNHDDFNAIVTNITHLRSAKMIWYWVRKCSKAVCEMAYRASYKSTVTYEKRLQFSAAPTRKQDKKRMFSLPTHTGRLITCQVKQLISLILYEWVSWEWAPYCPHSLVWTSSPARAVHGLINHFRRSSTLPQTNAFLLTNDMPHDQKFFFEIHITLGWMSYYQAVSRTIICCLWMWAFHCLSVQISGLCQQAERRT